MPAGKVMCDRCKQIVKDATPPEGGMTAGYYHGWTQFMDAGEMDVCDFCMWNDPRYMVVYGDVRVRSS